MLKKSSSFLKGSLNRNVVKFKYNTAFSGENSEFPKREISVYKLTVRNFESAFDQVMTDQNDFLSNGSNSQTRRKSVVRSDVGNGEYLGRPSAAHGESALHAYIERQDRNQFTNLAS